MKLKFEIWVGYFKLNVGKYILCELHEVKNNAVCYITSNGIYIYLYIYYIMSVCNVHLCMHVCVFLDL